MRAIIDIIARKGLIRCERGATAIEYGLIIAMVVLAIMVALSNIATKTTGMWNNVAVKVLTAQ
ncbi:Flp family type IVb pilin [Sphingobium sp.]|uniref:Flp family type IVb pilin n=1 Tax=Sphingobium sp. TaxID=1912891 RepID=UPI003BB796D1